MSPAGGAICSLEERREKASFGFMPEEASEKEDRGAR